MLPPWLGRTSRKDVPVGILIASSALASVLLLSNATRSLGGLMDFMLNLTAAATLWLYVGACASALALGIARVPAAIGLAFAVWALIGSGFEAGGLSVVLMLTAIPFYFLALRRAEQPPSRLRSRRISCAALCPRRAGDAAAGMRPPIRTCRAP